MSYYHKIFLLALFLVFIIPTKGQTTFQQGYIVNLENDTIHGLIGNSGEITNSKVCKFKTAKNSAVTKYKPEDIKMYRFNDGKYYKSIEVSHHDKYYLAFVEVLIDSEVKLYQNWKNNENSYYIEKNDTIKSLYNYELSAKDIYNKKQLANYSKNSYFNMSISLYKDTLLWAFSDCKELFPKILDLEYNTGSLIEITKEYLNSVFSKSNASSYYSENEYYEKDLTKSRSAFGVFSGMQMSGISFANSNLTSKLTGSVPIGISYNISLPKLNKGLSLQLELIYKKLNYNVFDSNSEEPFDLDIKTNQIGIPILLKYSRNFNQFTPSLGVGKEFNFVFNSDATFIANENTKYTPEELNIEQSLIHNNTKQGWFIDLGMDYKIKPKLSVYLSLRYQTFLNLLITDPNFNALNFKVAKQENKRYSVYGDEYKTNMVSLLMGIRF